MQLKRKSVILLTKKQKKKTTDKTDWSYRPLEFWVRDFIIILYSLSLLFSILLEPADCLDGDDSFYGKDLSLRHGEGQQVGDPTCPASWYVLTQRRNIKMCFVCLY